MACFKLFSLLSQTKRFGVEKTLLRYHNNSSSIYSIIYLRKFDLSNDTRNMLKKLIKNHFNDTKKLLIIVEIVTNFLKSIPMTDAETFRIFIILCSDHMNLFDKKFLKNLYFRSKGELYLSKICPNIANKYDKSMFDIQIEKDKNLNREETGLVFGNFIDNFFLPEEKIKNFEELEKEHLKLFQKNILMLYILQNPIGIKTASEIADFFPCFVFLFEKISIGADKEFYSTFDYTKESEIITKYIQNDFIRREFQLSLYKKKLLESQYDRSQILKFSCLIHELVRDFNEKGK